MLELYARDYDVVDDHKEADKLMCQVLRERGFFEGVKVFEESEKWYG
jgi:hypothetical protein